MLILGRDVRGATVVVEDLDSIDQVDWVVNAIGEYVYLFSIAGVRDVVTIHGGSLSDGGLEAIWLFSD